MPNFSSDMRVAVILPAAGRGERFAAGDTRAGHSSAASKIEFLLEGRPVFLHALTAFCGRTDVVQVLLAVAPDRIKEFEDRYGDRLRDLGVTLLAGAKQGRSETVELALKQVCETATHVAVHDAARPLVNAALIDRVFAAAAHHGAVVPALPVADTLVRGGVLLDMPEAVDPADAILGIEPSSATGVRPVTGAVDRSDVFGVQTPQVFEISLLRRAYAAVVSGRASGLASSATTATDDASLVTALGEPVVLVEGDPANLKLTHPADAEMLAALLDRRRATQAARDPLFFDDDEG